MSDPNPTSTPADAGQAQPDHEVEATPPSVDEPQPSGTADDRGQPDAADVAAAYADAPDVELDAEPEAEQDTEPIDLEAMAAADPRSKAEVLGALLTAEADRDEYLDDLRRARAEFENYRRRVVREGTTQRSAGTADAVTALLDVLDDLDRTLEAADGSPDPGLAKGVGLVASKLTQGLQSLGLQRIDTTGEPFDPNHHEAVQQIEGEEGADGPQVSQVLRPGYRLGDRVLRPAMVVVEG